MRTIFTVLLCLSVAGLLFLSQRKPPAAGAAPPSADVPAAASNRSITASVLHIDRASAATIDLHLRTRADLLWQGTPAEPAFAGFQNWANRYMSAPEAEKPGLEAEGK